MGKIPGGLKMYYERFNKDKEGDTFFGAMIILFVALVIFCVFIAYESMNLRTRELEYAVAHSQTPIVQTQSVHLDKNRQDNNKK